MRTRAECRVAGQVPGMAALATLVRKGVRRGCCCQTVMVAMVAPGFEGETEVSRKRAADPFQVSDLEADQPSEEGHYYARALIACLQEKVRWCWRRRET